MFNKVLGVVTVTIKEEGLKILKLDLHKLKT